MRRPTAPLLLTAALLTACGSPVPDTANGIIDMVEAADLIECRERREPVPDVVTCEDDDAGDLTVGLTDTPLDTIAATADSAGGPWIAGDGFVVISYDDDVERLREVRDAIGDGEVYTTTVDGTPEPTDG